MKTAAIAITTLAIGVIAGCASSAAAGARIAGVDLRDWEELS